MKRIIVIGCPGAGKTTFAEKLCKRLALPLYYLDAIWHRPDRTHISREEYSSRLSEILTQDAWIIDGNYSRTMEERMAACDTVFFLDLPSDVCLEGAIARLGTERYDMPWIDTKLDSTFERSIREFSEKNRPQIYELIEKYRNKKTVVIFKTREETDEFIEKLNVPICK